MGRTDHHRSRPAAWACLAAACFLTAACGREEPREAVATASTQRDAIEIAAALERSDVPRVRVSSRREGGRELHDVSVPSVAAPASRLALSELGLPRPQRDLASDESAFFPTRADDAARERRRRATALERALELLDGVSVASVVVAEPFSPDATGRQTATPRLLVTIRTAGLAGTAAETPLRDRVMLAVRAAFPEVDPDADATVLVSGGAGGSSSQAAKAAMAQAPGATHLPTRAGAGPGTIDRALLAVTVAAMLTLAWLQWRSFQRGTGGRA